MSITLILLVTVTVAALVQGALGVGFALIFGPVAALLRPELLPGSLLFLMLPLNAWVAWRERDQLDFPSAGWITAGRAFGTFAGLWVLIAIPGRALNLTVGAITILAAAATIAAPRFSPNHTAFVAAGLITGVTETATGIGGPPLALVYQYYAAGILRSTIALCFFIGELFSLAILFLNHRTGLDQLDDALILLPALVAGLGMSSWAARCIGPALMRKGLLAFAILSGLALVAQAAFQ